MRKKIHGQSSLRSQVEKKFEFLDKGKKLILVTGHRRESYGPGFESICDALKDIAIEFEKGVEIIFI